MKTLQFTQTEIEVLRDALHDYRKQFSRERRPEDVQVLTAVDNLLEKLPAAEGSGESDSE